MTPEQFKVEDRIRIRDGWEEAGKTGTAIGPAFFYGQLWTPVVWDDNEDPDFVKSIALQRLPDVETRKEKL